MTDIPYITISEFDYKDKHFKLNEELEIIPYWDEKHEYIIAEINEFRFVYAEDIYDIIKEIHRSFYVDWVVYTGRRDEDLSPGAIELKRSLLSGMKVTDILKR